MGESVLIIDDNETTRESLRSLLAGEGFSVDTCDGGSCALGAVKTRRYDTFIVDYRMPEMKGDALARVLRETMPEAFIVGYSVEGRGEEFQKAGADAFLTKDLLVQRLVSLIQGRFQIF
jgi:CheY-like chemotaxis protein